MPSPRSWIKAWALCALWAACFVAPARTGRADCSHPDRPAIGVGAASPGDLAGLDAGQDAAGPLARIRPTSPERPRPCSGPECSGKSAPTAPSTPAVRPAVSAEPWAWVAEPPAADPAPCRRVRPEDPAAAPIAAPSSIFHPPRRAS